MSLLLNIYKPMGIIIGGYEAEEIHVQGPDLTEVQVMMTITL